MSELRPSYTRDDVLSPGEIRAALPPMSDRKWDDVKARIPWTRQIGKRMPCISWGAFLTWLEQRDVA
jgi:hypothetical protein